MSPEIMDFLALVGHILIIILLGVTWRWHIEDKNVNVALVRENQRLIDRIDVLEKEIVILKAPVKANGLVLTDGG